MTAIDTMSYAAFLRDLRHASACTSCGKRTVVVNVTPTSATFKPERITAEQHCFCWGSPVWEYAVPTVSHEVHFVADVNDWCRANGAEPLGEHGGYLRDSQLNQITRAIQSGVTPAGFLAWSLTREGR